LALHAVEAALDKKAHNLAVMDVRTVSGVADYFVVCTGDVDLHVKAIVEAVRTRIREQCQERTWHVEGLDHLQWVLLDYVDVVVHVFLEEKRNFYSLERLWGDAPIEYIPDDGDAASVKMLRPQPPSAPSPSEA
jgi:ribosome-associated protein